MTSQIATIPKRVSGGEELVVIPRKEYEVLLEVNKIKEFIPTAAQKRDLKRARQDYKKGKYITFDELKRQLGIKN